jgi:hypothetical protein
MSEFLIPRTLMRDHGRPAPIPKMKEIASIVAIQALDVW